MDPSFCSTEILGDRKSGCLRRKGVQGKSSFYKILQRGVLSAWNSEQGGFQGRGGQAAEQKNRRQAGAGRALSSFCGGTTAPLKAGHPAVVLDRVLGAGPPAGPWTAGWRAYGCGTEGNNPLLGAILRPEHSCGDFLKRENSCIRSRSFKSCLCSCVKQCVNGASAFPSVTVSDASETDVCRNTTVSLCQPWCHQ